MSMIVRRTVLKSLGLAAAMPLAGCFSSSVTRRVKVIAMAEVDGKPVEGSSVYEITWNDYGDRVLVSETGEATVLELAGRGTVFVLNGNRSLGTGLFNFGDLNGQVASLVGKQNGHIDPELFPKVKALEGRYAYQPASNRVSMPLMVAFRDEKRFRSIYEVKAEGFPQIFGGGVEFKGIEFEFTDEPVTKVLEQRLPCLKPPYEDAPPGIYRDAQGKLRPPAEIPFEWNISPEHFVTRGF